VLSRVQSFVLTGIDARPCEVEVDLREEGFYEAQVVGLPDAAVRESIERVRSAVLNSGYRFPAGRHIINLAPADIRKEGPVYDLPIALAVLLGDGVIPPPGAAGKPARAAASEASASSGAGDRPTPLDSLETADASAPLDPRQYLFAGELALDGRVRPVRGVIAMAMLARQRGLRGVVAPAANVTEAAVVDGVEAIGVRTLAEVVGMMTGHLPVRPHPPVDVGELIRTAEADVDFAEVRGQEPVKRAITVAAAGGHNLLMLGPAGTGKTMMARALPGVLPPLTPEEALEVTRIYSAAGRLRGGSDNPGLVTVRPVRAPHHTISMPALVGGGPYPKPGEISLGHHGVVFLDELPEFPRQVLETLRQPLEEGAVTINRASASATFPARFMFVAALNPTPKGAMPTDAASQREMDRYLARISGPLVDRVDIHVEAPGVPWKELSSKGPRGTSSARMRDRVLQARDRQRARQGSTLNARLRGRELDELAITTDGAKALLGQAITELGLSARAYDKIRRVARTIADLEGADLLDAPHVAEAVQYRLLDRRL